MDEEEVVKVEETEPMPEAKNGMATASLVMGIIGVVTGIIFIGSLFGLLAIIFGVVALLRVAKKPEIGGKTKAIIGIVLGGVAIALLFFAAILAAVAIPRFMAASKKTKISEAKLVVKQIWMAEQVYYEENGCFTGAADDIFGTGSVPDGLIVGEPSGVHRFDYYITDVADFSDGDAVLIYAMPNMTDASLYDVSDIEVTVDGVVSGGDF